MREALALGRRVIASAVGNRPPEAELVPPGDADALAQAMLAAREAPAAAATDSIERILSLYQGVPACAASAAS